MGLSTSSLLLLLLSLLLQRKLNGVVSHWSNPTNFGHANLRSESTWKLIQSVYKSKGVGVVCEDVTLPSLCIIIARVIKTYTHHNTITSENAPLTNPPSLIAKSRNFHKLIVGSLNVLRISSALMELAVTLLLVLMGEVDDDILERWCMMVTTTYIVMQMM